MDIIAWIGETHAQARPSLEAALTAAGSDDVPDCAQAAKAAALCYLRRYLELVGEEAAAAGDRVADLLAAAMGRDQYFERLRREAEVLDAGRASVDELVEALKEVRFLAMGRAGKGTPHAFRLLPEAPDPRMAELLAHATPAARAVSVFAQGALLSFNECVRRGLLWGRPVGAEVLLDPRRLLDYVLFHLPDNIYAAGEKVANSQRKGVLDESMEEDYQPSVRLFFLRDEIRGLEGFCDDGVHPFAVRGRVSLAHLLCATFSSEAAREAALAAAAQPERFRARCAVAPPDCCADPHTYVRATNDVARTFLDACSPAAS